MVITVMGVQRGGRGRGRCHGDATLGNFLKKIRFSSRADPCMSKKIVSTQCLFLKKLKIKNVNKILNF